MTQFGKGKFKRKLLASAIVAPMIVLAGCADNDGNNNQDVPSGVASGVAYDGYLVGATVCVDVNLNKACDEGEPSAVTEAGGQFDIIGLTEEQQLKPLILEANENTIDEDTGEAVDPGLKYSAPGGSKAVSGLSTVIQSKVEQAIAAGETGTLEELKKKASDELAAQLGLAGKDLTSYDPLAVADDAPEEEKQAAAKAHVINQVVTQQLVTVKAAAEANSGTSDAATYVAAIRAVEATVQNVVQTVDNFIETGGEVPPLDSVTSAILPEDAPEVPSAEDIQQIAEEYEQLVEDIESKVDEEVNEEPTGATGATS